VQPNCNSIISTIIRCVKGFIASNFKINSTSSSYTITKPSFLSPTNYFGGPPNSATSQVVTQSLSFDGVPGSGLPAGVCGRFDFQYDSSLPAANSVANAQATAIKTMISALTPLAAQIVAAPTIWSSSSTSSVPSLPSISTVYSAINSYQNSISAAAASAESSLAGNKAALSSWMSNAQNGGWITAGSFYFSFAKENQRLSQLVANKWSYQGIAVNALSSTSMGSEYSLKTLMPGVDSYLAKLDQTGNFVGNPPSAANVGTAASSVAGADGGFYGKLLSLLSSPFTGLLNVIGASLTNGGDPILTAQGIGMDMIDVGEGTAIAFATTITVGEAAVGSANGIERGIASIPVIGGVVGAVAGAVSGGTEGVLKGIEKIGVPLMFAIVIPLIVMGATLAYVLPALPFMFWVFGVWNYVLLLIEGVVAVPIWGIMHAKPEGEGFLPQEASKGYMNLLLIFLTPSVMIFGFFASFMILDTLSIIVFDGWGAMVGSVTANSLTGIVGFLAIMSVFDIIMIQGARKIFHYTLITFPQWVLGWGNIQGESSHGDVPGGREEFRLGGVGQAAGSGAGAAIGMSAAGHQGAREEQRKSAAEAAAKEASKQEKAADQEAFATSIANKLAPHLQGHSSGGGNKNNGDEASLKSNSRLHSRCHLSKANS
jgi:conjugal transfer/type IV secretion protein DotA/TraY